jgi:hypothetical protein
VCETAHPWLVAFTRTSLDESQRILVLVNVSDQRQELELENLVDSRLTHDLLSEAKVHDGVFALNPCQIAWLT